MKNNGGRKCDGTAGFCSYSGIPFDPGAPSQLSSGKKFFSVMGTCADIIGAMSTRKSALSEKNSYTVLKEVPLPDFTIKQLQLLF